MGRISEFTVRRIREAANIVDIVGDFVRLSRKGKDYEGLCPFHDDRHKGSFVVSPQRNMCKCFSCGKSYDPIGFLMNIEGGHTYREALEYVATRYGIPIEEETEKTKTMILPRIINHETAGLPPLITFPRDYVIRSMREKENNLTTWMRSLPWSDEDKEMLDQWMKLYAVGTSQHGRTKGWTAFWYMDEELRARNCKFMAYLPDGHRDKELNPYARDGQLRHYNFDWFGAMTDKDNPRNCGKGIWSSREARTELCLFGLHLVDSFPEAEVCIVESEKTAILAQTASKPGEKIFMATGSKSALTRKQLEPLIKRNRWIILYPDIDGIEQWRQAAKAIGYDKIQISPNIQRLYDPQIDGEKADIGDIIVRMLRQASGMTISERAHMALGLKEENEALTNMIDQLKLTF